MLWFMLEIAVMPMLGMGIFGSSGPGIAGSVAALIAHLLYGAILRAIAGEAHHRLEAARAA
jgi:NADH:ubiquinone oxidoreductase subunit 4 (subunit M)